MYIIILARRFIAPKHFLALSASIAIGIASLIAASFMFRVYETGMRNIMLGKSPHVSLSGKFSLDEANKWTKELTQRQGIGGAWPVLRIEGEITAYKSADETPSGWGKRPAEQKTERKFSALGSLPVVITGIPVKDLQALIQGSRDKSVDDFREMQQRLKDVKETIRPMDDSNILQTIKNGLIDPKQYSGYFRSQIDEIIQSNEQKDLREATLKELELVSFFVDQRTPSLNPDIERLLPPNTRLLKLGADNPDDDKLRVLVSRKILSSAGIDLPTDRNDFIASFSMLSTENIRQQTPVREFVTYAQFTEQLITEQRSSIIIARHKLWQMLGDNTKGKVNAIDLRLEDPYRAKQVSEALAHEFPNLRVSNWMEEHEGALAFLNTLRTVTLAVVGLMVLVSGFGIASVLYLTVLEKRAQIAVLKSLGATSFQVSRIFVAIALLVGIVGSLAGVIAGYTAIWTLSENRTNWIGHLLGKAENALSIPISDVALIVVGTWLMCILFSLAPAYSAAKQQPVESLKG